MVVGDRFQNKRVEEQISAQRFERSRVPSVKTRKPRSLPSGTCKATCLTEAGALWCLRVDLAARRVGKMRARRARCVHLDVVRPRRVCASASCSRGVCGQPAGRPCLLDFGSRLGMLDNKCSQNAVLGL